MTNLGNILYVEDCEISVNLLTKLLKRHCSESIFTLDIAATVTEALALFDKDRHTAVLIDWNLPDGDGTEVAEHIRDLHSSLPIVFLSAVLTDDHYQTAKKYSPADCLEKDYTQPFIDRVVKHIPIQ